MGGGSRACVYRRRLCCADFDERIERRRKSITTTGEDNGLRRSERTVICAGVHNDASGYASTSYDREEVWRSEENTSELQSLMRISYAVFCLKKKTYTADNKT